MAKRTESKMTGSTLKGKIDQLDKMAKNTSEQQMIGDLDKTKDR